MLLPSLGTYSVLCTPEPLDPFPCKLFHPKGISNSMLGSNSLAYRSPRVHCAQGMAIASTLLHGISLKSLLNQVSMIVTLSINF